MLKQMGLIASRCSADIAKGWECSRKLKGLEAIFGLGNWKRVCSGDLEQYPV